MTKRVGRSLRLTRGDAPSRGILSSFVILISTCGPLAPGEAFAQEVPGERGLVFDVAWPTERIELTDGRVLRGLVEEETGGHLQFLEVRRRPGQTPSLVRRFLAAGEIAKLDRLSAEDRAELARRLDAVERRAAIEAGRMPNVELEQVDRDGITFWTYTGPWFRLEAALQPWEVRTMVIRLEQMFHGFQQVVGDFHAAPAATDRELSFVIFGDHRHYAAFLRRQGLAIRNPAFFDPAEMRVVVSSDLSRLHDLQRTIEENHDRGLSERFPRGRSSLADALARLDEELRAGGYSEVERQRIVRLAVSRWRAEEAALQRQVRRANQRNTDEVFKERQRLQHRLFHEAFHAYAEQSVFTDGQTKMPRWLAEGLAQIFESALFEADDLLRIDAPDPERLARLQADLASAAPLRLEDLLAADQASYLVPHDASGRTSERHYLYAWGLAYYLAFEHAGFTAERLSEYVATSHNRPRDAFEQLIGMPLDEFEPTWRNAMREIAISH